MDHCSGWTKSSLKWARLETPFLLSPETAPSFSISSPANANCGSLSLHSDEATNEMFLVLATSSFYCVWLKYSTQCLVSFLSLLQSIMESCVHSFFLLSYFANTSKMNLFNLVALI